ncbi:hypothetical protein E3O42_01200 [Cryobacterium adonitolivorans]|uniref:Uncharacterized protein n=1 Tax=Cryobacterium adonitolivorans TaxID=1259189 RepID=A0A4R8WGC2_9MICO|nr:hypothetical protein [Cryobacterium adonitolivorans]TFC07024.1 hypothetical protein E3O42_01200 [Cryobacterium adonitolivorans]
MIRVELERLAEYHAGVELLFAFYFSRRDGLFRDRIEASFGRYLEAFLPVCREVAGTAGAPGDAAGSVSGDDIAAAVVALIQGASIQAIRSPASVSSASVSSASAKPASVHAEALLATIRALRPPAP